VKQSTPCLFPRGWRCSPDADEAWSVFAILGVLDFQSDCEGLNEAQILYRERLIAKVYEFVSPYCKTNIDEPPLIEWLRKIEYMEDYLPLDIAQWWDKIPEQEKRAPVQLMYKGLEIHAEQK